MTEPSRKKKRIHGIYVSTLYFAEGLPYTIVVLMSVIFFKDLGASNEFIGLTSFLYIPWTIKLLWGPVVDIYGTKRRWILTMEVIITALIAAIALGSFSPHAITIAIILFSLIAFASATHDISIDGFYLDALNHDQQAFYSGFRTTAYKIAFLTGTGGLVYIAGLIKESTFSPQTGWSVAFGLAAVIFLAVFFFQLWYLPFPKAAPIARGTSSAEKPMFFRVFMTYFQQRRIGVIVLYILIFRLGDAFMLKMAPPFLMDAAEKGGLAIPTAQIGVIYGTVGMIFLLLGGIVGGFLIAKQGLKRWMWPTALLQNSAIILYYLLAIYQPNVYWVAVVNSFEQFSYGLGVSAYTVFLMRTVRPEFKASHYAISTALMAVGVMLPGAASGFLTTALGYKNFFLMSFLVAIPGLFTIFFLPLEEKEKEPLAATKPAIATANPNPKK